MLTSHFYPINFNPKKKTQLTKTNFWKEQTSKLNEHIRKELRTEWFGSKSVELRCKRADSEILKVTKKLKSVQSNCNHPLPIVLSRSERKFIELKGKRSLFSEENCLEVPEERQKVEASKTKYSIRLRSMAAIKARESLMTKSEMAKPYFKHEGKEMKGWEVEEEGNNDLLY